MAQSREYDMMRIVRRKIETQCLSNAIDKKEIRLNVKCKVKRQPKAINAVA
jgi:hypothetical protein